VELLRNAWLERKTIVSYFFIIFPKMSSFQRDY
jgi:hypothetical protein